MYGLQTPDDGTWSTGMKMGFGNGGVPDGDGAELMMSTTSGRFMKTVDI